MSVLVNTQSEHEEKVLLAFLDSLQYNYRANIEDNPSEISRAFIDQYNEEIDQANLEIESGNYVSHQDVEQLFKNRRKAL